MQQCIVGLALFVSFSVDESGVSNTSLISVDNQLPARPAGGYQIYQLGNVHQVSGEWNNAVTFILLLHFSRIIIHDTRQCTIYNHLLFQNVFCSQTKL